MSEWTVTVEGSMEEPPYPATRCLHFDPAFSRSRVFAKDEPWAPVTAAEIQTYTCRRCARVIERRDDKVSLMWPESDGGPAANTQPSYTR